MVLVSTLSPQRWWGQKLHLLHWEEPHLEGGHHHVQEQGETWEEEQGGEQVDQDEQVEQVDQGEGGERASWPSWPNASSSDALAGNQASPALAIGPTTFLSEVAFLPPSACHC